MRYNPDTEGPQVPGRQPTRIREYERELRESNIVGPTDAELHQLIAEASADPTLAVAEHTGDRTFLIADDVADCLVDNGVAPLTSGQRLLIANVLRRYGV